jgi:hypothetical protein
MNFPDDARLIAIGKYSMLGRERYAQIERVQTIAKTIMHLANPLLKDCEQEPPDDGTALKALQDCLRNAENARERIISLCAERAALKPEAWPK